MGIAAVVGLVVGFEPSKLPPALLDIAAYKLAFGAAAALLAAGALISRRSNRPGDARTEKSGTNAASGATARAILPEPPASEISRPQPENIRAEKER